MEYVVYKYEIKRKYLEANLGLFVEPIEGRICDSGGKKERQIDIEIIWCKPAFFTLNFPRTRYIFVMRVQLSEPTVSLKQ